MSEALAPLLRNQPELFGSAASDATAEWVQYGIDPAWPVSAPPEPVTGNWRGRRRARLVA